jgi:uncharacterized protein (TIGR02118 family)
MYTLMVLYSEANRSQQFRDYYESTHLPLATQLPGLRASRFSLDVEAADGATPYCAVFEADFDSADAMHLALASPEGQATQADVANFAGAGVLILHFLARSA